MSLNGMSYALNFGTTILLSKTFESIFDFLHLLIRGMIMTLRVNFLILLHFMNNNIHFIAVLSM